MHAQDSTAATLRAYALAELDAGGPMTVHHRQDSEAIDLANLGLLDRLDRGQRPPDETSLATALLAVTTFVVCLALMWGACTAAAHLGLL